ncbi:hypothetical protein CAOG_04603 [Capsaspora owczarzaki ATCC 30864]|uniref:50S ribosomal protein L20 n=1 Tax=Capsaspora owczarzaki (strain ATCC 30864) TaxID=595528 RepID=A0A0D2X388_CAPO3|nr:hypothetical protein CAOG_04603 [Capsaspora owczarzaki ATCC 30864]KJE93884.1 hypothetical protein CAOG_004603 [Capsaspora owczarzaki ATCC 30864]|eukprot:XP_004347350.1 hypothetical protein CAOG_04603 [Capsaspora owczarzaki ATCC 30864]
MVRITSYGRSARRRTILNLARGFYGRAKNCYSIAIQRVHKGLQHAYKGRKLKKRTMRQNWVARIGAAVREYGLSYSRFMHGLVLMNCQIDRKVLSQLAIYEPMSFRSLVDMAAQLSVQSHPSVHRTTNLHQLGNVRNLLGLDNSTAIVSPARLMRKSSSFLHAATAEFVKQEAGASAATATVSKPSTSPASPRSKPTSSKTSAAPPS